MKRINLLPPEERGQSFTGFTDDIVGVMLVVAAALIALIAIVSLFCLFRLNALDSEIAEIEAESAERQNRIAELQPYANLESEIASKQPVADGVVRSRFAWSEFLRGLAFVIPDTTQLETLTAEASPVDITAPIGQVLQPPGAVTFTGYAEPDNVNLADFVLRMDTLRFLANSQLDLAELDRETFQTEALNFEVSSELLTEVGASETEVRLAEEDQASQQSPAGAAGDQYATEDASGVAAAVEQQYEPDTVGR